MCSILRRLRSTFFLSNFVITFPIILVGRPHVQHSRFGGSLVATFVTKP
jgi:hypothetical protein